MFFSPVDTADLQSTANARQRPSAHFIPFPLSDIEQSVPDRFELQVKLHSDRPALVTRKDQLTYELFNRRANQIAWALLRLRDEKAEPVALLLERDAACYAAIFAVLKAGKFYVPLSPSYPPARNAMLLEDAGVAVIITDGANAAAAHALATDRAARVLNVDELPEGLEESNPGLTISSDAYAYILYTSGTTGRPKGVVETHRHLLHNTRTNTNCQFLGSDDRLLSVSSIAFSGSLKDIFGSLLNGAALLPVDVQKEGLAGLGNWLAQERITVYSSVPSIYRQLLGTLTGAEDLSAVRMVRLGGEPVTPRDVELFRRHFGLGCVLVNGYGSTETGTSIYGRLDELADASGRLPIGQPLPGFDVGILDEQGTEVAPGEIGEITIRSRYLAAGYWGQPELTASIFRECDEGDGLRTYRTGDLGRRLSDGSIVCLGRQDSQVKVRGQRVELGEVEHQLLQVPGIKEAVVLARADDGRELYLAAYLVWQAGMEPLQAAELRRQLRQHLPDCAVPSAFVDVETLPMNGNGKVDVRALPAPAPAGRTAPASVHAAPRNERERLLAEIWCEVLQLSNVGLQDNFFDLGGDSLAAAHLFVAIEKAFGMRLPMEWLLESGSVEQLARRIADRTPVMDSLLVPLQLGGDRPPFYCVSAVGGEVYSYRALAAHLGPDQPFYGIKARVPASDEATVRSLEETATVYVEELLGFQPAGPYLLGGYSFGGAVAYEMARQLQSRGHEVALLAIIDQRRPNLVPAHSWSARRIGLFLRNLPHWIRDELLHTADAPARIRRKLAHLFRHACARLLPGQPALSPSDTPAWLDESQVPADYLRLFRHNFRMLRSYLPQPYAGAVTLFRARCQPLAPAAWHERDMGWGCLPRGGVKVIDIPGNHSSLLEEPYVCTLARQLRAVLDDAMAASRSPRSALPAPRPPIGAANTRPS